MSEVLQVLPTEHAKYEPILAHFRRHVDSLLRWQASSGCWHNVLDRADSPEEVSGTAIFVMALARGVRLGWLAGERYRTAACKGWQALTSAIEADGTVHKICVGTMCSEDEEYYVKRPFYDNDTHGLFAVLFAGIEMHLLSGGK
jgi:rhamnogalacturonyl hydrolase YesR